MNAMLTSIVQSCGQSFRSFLRQRLAVELASGSAEPVESTSVWNIGRRVEDPQPTSRNTESRRQGVAAKAIST